MFATLTGKLQDTLKRLRGEARLTETNIAASMEEIRLALIDADVNQEIAGEFVKSVAQGCLGEDVLRSVSPGQMAVKIVHDKLTELMGTGAAPLADNNLPTVIMLVGLHGSGKTTSTAKLAVNLKKRGKKVLLVAGDVYRPAAIDQLETLGREAGVKVHAERGNPNVVAIATNALAEARSEGVDYLIIDTAGRLQIDTSMVQELIRLSQATGAHERLLVADAALGQQAVSVAKHFNDAVSLTGVILTKIDGDARGGAALSIRKVANCPIKFVGVGERLDELEVFHPDRMASRILGMGDIVSLVEKASAEIDKEEAQKLEAKLKKNEFDFNDFLSNLNQMKRMGGLESIVKMLPGGDKVLGNNQFDTSQFTSMEAMVCSMTKHERANPDAIDFARRKRIAKGSGTSPEQVGQLIKQFNMMRKMMKNTGLMGRLLSGAAGHVGGLGGLGFRDKMGRGSNYTPPKKKRKKH